MPSEAVANAKGRLLTENVNFPSLEEQQPPAAAVRKIRLSIQECFENF